MDVGGDPVAGLEPEQPRHHPAGGEVELAIAPAALAEVKRDPLGHPRRAALEDPPTVLRNCGTATGAELVSKPASPTSCSVNSIQTPL